MSGSGRGRGQASLDGGEGGGVAIFRDEDRKIMDDLGSEVFNLKLAIQEYEDRLAQLYQTEDRSKWKGSATLIVSFFCGSMLMSPRCCLMGWFIWWD